MRWPRFRALKIRGPKSGQSWKSHHTVMVSINIVKNQLFAWCHIMKTLTANEIFRTSEDWTLNWSGWIKGPISTGDLNLATVQNGILTHHSMSKIIKNCLKTSLMIVCWSKVTFGSSKAQFRTKWVRKIRNGKILYDYDIYA